MDVCKPRTSYCCKYVSFLYSPVLYNQQPKVTTVIASEILQAEDVERVAAEITQEQNLILRGASFVFLSLHLFN